MTKSNNTMTRDEMQTEALVIENLLETAIAMYGGIDPNDGLTMVEMAHDRARRINRALDCVNAP